MQLTALALWLNTAFAGFDEAVATAIHQLYVAAGWFFTPFLSFISLLGKGGIFLILLSIALMLFRKTRRYGTTMLLALAIGALVTNVCFKPLVARPRPYTHDGSIFQQYWEMLGKHTESDKSFPSGHMTAAMAASLAVFLRGNKKISWTALLFALAMGVSRIYLSVHYATDVLGGVITGSIGGFAGYAISNRIPESFYTADFRDYIDRLKAKKSGGKGAGRSTAAAAAAEPSDGRRRTLVIDGANFSTMDGLFREFNRLFDVGPDEAVHSLDALNDLLGGGIGKIPAGARLHIRWLNSEKSREDFGYGATVIYYEKLLRRCHPNNRPRMEALLAEARRGEGETLFEKLTALIARTDTGHDCTHSLE